MRFLIWSGASLVFGLAACLPGSGDLGFGGSAGSGGSSSTGQQPPCPLNTCSGERCKDDGDCASLPGTFCGECSDDNFKHCLILLMKGECCTRDEECVSGVCRNDDAGTVGACTGVAGR